MRLPPSTLAITPDLSGGCARTQLAERTILDDLEYLIRNSVDPKRADYAVISGVQVRHQSAMQYL